MLVLIMIRLALSQYNHVLFVSALYVVLPPI